MPHKHKRKHDDDTALFDLDPQTQAKPLPAYKPPSVFMAEPSNKRRKSNSAAKGEVGKKDDTPKAFARMMAWQANGKRPSGLDDGVPRSEKSRKDQKDPKAAKTQIAHPDIGETLRSEIQKSHPPASPRNDRPQILAGESLSQFALRVDQSLPLSAIAKSASNPNMPADIKPKARLTKHNKRLQKMIADWRDVDLKQKEKLEEEQEDLEEKREEEDILWDKVRAVQTSQKGKKKNTKGKGPADDDPWKELDKRRREETRQRGLQDVVQAPPALVKVNSKFKIKESDLHGINGKKHSDMDGDVVVEVKDVPHAVGSLRQREEMRKKRQEVIEGYRKMNRRRLKGKGLSHPLPRSIMA